MKRQARSQALKCLPPCLRLIINAAHTQKEAQIRMILPSDMGFEQKFQYEFVGSLNKNLIFLPAAKRHDQEVDLIGVGL